MPPEVVFGVGAVHALLLQGPVGPFFRRFARELKHSGIEVTKVNFHAGDGLFYRGSDVVAFRRPMDEWPEFFRTLVADRDIDAVFLFGDCRPIHRQAIEIAKQRGIQVWVFEEGYLRPDHVTLERGGVNGYSSMPKDPAFYRRAASGLPEAPRPIQVGNTFRHWAWYTALNSAAMTFLCWRYPHYRHHRSSNAFKQALCWVRGAFRKLWFGLRERGRLEKLSGELSDQYFFVPLQVYCDSQIHHSDYRSITEFIEDVVATFVEHAPADTLLVFKHHPHDRAYRDYSRCLRELGERYGCADRIVYVHDLHLPTLLQNARGTVTMNSTVGASSMYHGTPVKVLGRAVYDIDGLTFRGQLGEFFRAPGSVDQELYESFCRWLRETNQVNGSFYKRARGLSKVSGLRLTIPRERTRADTPPAVSAGASG